MERYKYVVLFSFLLVLLASESCKKEIGSRGGGNEKEVCELTNDSLEIQIRDSVFYYTKLFSLWEEYLPPRNVNDIDNQSVVQRYTFQYCTGEDVLRSLKALTPIRNGSPIDRFSFLDRAGEVSEEIEGGMVTSFGMYVYYLMRDDKSNDADLYVRMVDKGSPAYKAGIKRGTRILSLNGNSNISYNAQESKDFKDVNDALFASELKVRFVNPEEDIEEALIYNVKFELDPIQVDTVYSIGEKNIGYLAYSSFLGLTDLKTKKENDHYYNLEEVFQNFESKNISELVIDLRYNGGGSVSTAEYIANWLAPQAANGQLMFNYKVNRYLDDWGWTDEDDFFAPVRFNKKGALNLSQVYFLVTKATASASELLINVLEPYMDVQLIGAYGTDSQGKSVKENTYGKPVGFFGWPIVGDDIELFVTSFQLTNKDGKSDYFEGLAPDYHSYEGFLKDFGDTGESMIASALNHIIKGSFETPYLQAYASSNVSRRNRGMVVKVFEKDWGRNDMFKFMDRSLPIRP